MDQSEIPKLKFLQAESTLVPVKLELFRALTTDELKVSLAPGEKACLKVRPDGTVLDGHHRIVFSPSVAWTFICCRER